MLISKKCKKIEGLNVAIAFRTCLIMVIYSRSQLISGIKINECNKISSAVFILEMAKNIVREGRSNQMHSKQIQI